MSKTRVTVTLDETLVEAVKASVLEGRSGSVSAFVGEALEARMKHDTRLRALAEAVAWYEAEHGEFTDAEMADLERRDRLVVEAARDDVREAG